MNAYSELYVNDIVETQGDMFLAIREELPNVDEKWFIERYMNSNIRRLLDHANPKFAAMPAPELILYFIEEECGNEYQKGDKWWGFLPQWVGLVYAFYQWKYNVPSARIIELLPTSEMEVMFQTLHQAGIETAVDKIHEVVLGKGACYRSIITKILSD